MLSDARAETFLRDTDAEQDWYLKSYCERLVGIPEASTIEPGTIRSQKIDPQITPITQMKKREDFLADLLC
jgi:hypothetical protein